MSNVDLPVASRPSATAPAGGAPALDGVATLVEHLRGHLEAIEDHTLTALAPFADDLAEVDEALAAVTDRLGGSDRPAPRPAPRHNTAVAEAVGVLVDPPGSAAEVHDDPTEQDDRQRRMALDDWKAHQ